MKQIQRGEPQGGSALRQIWRRVRGASAPDPVLDDSIVIRLSRGNLKEVRVSRRKSDRGTVVYLTVNKSTDVSVEGLG